MAGETTNNEKLRMESEQDTDPRVDLAVERTELASGQNPAGMDQDLSWIHRQWYCARQRNGSHS